MPPKPASASSPHKSFSGTTMISLDDLVARILNQLSALQSEHIGRNAKNNNNNNSQHNDPNNNNINGENSPQTYGILTTLSLSYADGCAVSAMHRWIDWSTGEFSRNVIITHMRKNKIGKINKNVESSPQPQTISTLCSSIRVELFKLHTACSYRVGLQVALSHAITVWIMTELRLLWSTFLVNDTSSSSSKKKSKTSSQKSENNEKVSRGGSQTTAISCINATLVDFSRWLQRIVLGGSSMYDSAVVESVYESKRIILSECVASWVSHLVVQQQKSKQRTELAQSNSSSVLPWHKQLLDVAIKPFLGIVVTTSSSQQEVQQQQQQQRGNSTTNGRRSNKIDNNNNNNNNNSSLSAFASPRELCDEICQKFGSAASLRQWENSLKKVIARKLETNNNNINKNEGENSNLFLAKRTNHQSSVIFGTPFVTSSPAGSPDKMFESLLFTLHNILSLKYNKISTSSTANRTTTTPSALVYFAKASLSTLVAGCDSFLLFKNFGEQHSTSSTSPFYQNFIDYQNSANTVSGNFLNKTMQLIQLLTSTNPFLEQEITQSLLINMDEDLSPRIANQVISRSRLLLRDCGILVGKNDLQQNGTANKNNNNNNNNSDSLTISTQIRASIFKIVALISSIVNNNNNNSNNASTTITKPSTTSLSSSSSSTFDFQSIRSYYKGENFGATLLGIDSSESHHYTSRPEHGAALAPASTLDTIIPGESDISLATFRISAALATIPLGSVKAIDVLRRMLVRRGMMIMSSSSSSSINNNNNNRNNNSAIISCAQLDSASVDVDHSGSDASSKGSGISSFSGSAADAQVPISFTTPYFLTNGNAGNNNNTKKSQQQLNLHYLQSAAAANRLLDWVVVQVPSKSTLHCVLDTIGQTVPHFSDSRPALLRQAVSLLVSPAIPTETLAEYLTSSVLIASSSSINSLGSTRSFVLHVISSAAQAYSLTRLRRCIEVLILKVGFQFPLLTKEFARVIRDFSLINFYKFQSSNENGGSNNNNNGSTSSEIAISKISAENLILALERRVSDVKPVDRDLGASLLRCARQALTHQATILKMLRAVQIPKMDNNGKNGYSSQQNQHQHFLLAHQKLINAFSRRSHEVCLRLFRCIANRFEDILVSTEAMMMMSSLQLLDLTNAAEVSGVNPSGLPATLKSTSSSFLRTTAGPIEPLQGNNNSNIIGKKSISMIDDKEAAAETQSTKKKVLGAFDWSLVEFSVKSYPIMTTATPMNSKIDDHDDEDENNNQSEYHSASISSSSAFSPSHFISCGVQVEVKKAAVVFDSASSGFVDNDDDDDDDEEKYLQLVTIEVWSPRIPLLQSSKKNRHSKNKNNFKTRNSGDHDQMSSNNNNNNKRILLESFTTLLNLKKLISNSKNHFTNVSMLSSPLKKQTAATTTKTPTLKINIACNNLRLPFASSISVSPFSPYEDYDGGIEELHLDVASNSEQEEDGDDENNNNNIQRTTATKRKKSSLNNNHNRKSHNSSLPTKTPKSSLQFIRSNIHENNDSDQEDNDVDDENDSNGSEDGNAEKNVSRKKSNNSKNKNSDDESDDDGEGNDQESDDDGDDALERDPNRNENDDDEGNCDDDPENVFSARHNNNEEDFYNEHQNSSLSSSPLQPCDAPLIVIRLAHHQYSDNNNNPNSENDKTKNNNNNNNHGSNTATISVLPLSVSSALAWRNLISDEEQKLAFQMMKDNTDNNLIVTTSIVALPLFDDDDDDDDDDNNEVPSENNNYNTSEASIPKHRKERIFRKIKNFFEKNHGIISSISNGSRCYSFVARARYPPVLVQVSISSHDEELTNDEYGQEYLILNLKCVPLLEGLVSASNNNKNFQQNGVDDDGEEQNHSVFRLEQKILHSLDAVEDAIVQGMKQ